MNIFKKMNDQHNAELKQPIEPNELFYSLKKKNDYSYLRGIQEEALLNWHDRRNEENVLVKMNTGAGKTLVGLLMLYSKLIETNSRSVFLCPDRQLVSQVYQQSQNYNIPTCIIDRDNEFPEDFLNKKAILITTIQRLFNGKNIFDRQRVEIGAIIIDDAHKCVEKVKDSFTIKFDDNHQVYSQLFDLFTVELKKQAIGSFEAIKSKQPDYFMKLPFWTWLENKEKIIKILSGYISERETLLFTWDLFHNNYDQYELFITANKIEISPIKCFVSNIQSYTNAKHKYALSATFENDLSLFFDLDFSVDSILKPIEPKDRKDYGQRLILAPKRYFPEFDDDNLVKVIRHHLNNNQNVVVLVPSYREANQWEKLGAKKITENIEDEIEKLKKSKGHFIVLANRYDGIDLGGDACNVLIIHEHPKYKFLKDRYLENILHTTNINLIAQTIEQGMGRTVRSGNDYSVIYLLGKNMLRFLRHKENFKFLNKHTRKQIEMGLNLLSEENSVEDNNYSKAIYETADFCLSQNKDWLTYYQSFMKNDNKEDIEIDRSQLLSVKLLERNAVIEFVNGKNKEALELAREILKKDLRDPEIAIYNLFCANISYGMDKNVSNDFVLRARNFSRHMFEPFLAQQYIKKQLKSENQFNKALKYLLSFSTMNDAINSFNEALSFLRYDPENDANKFEESVKNIGKILGFNSFRPEKELYEGCDNIWVLDDNCCLVIEAKSEKLTKNLISKNNVSQLLHSLNWFENRYLNENISYFGVTMQTSRKTEVDVEINDKLRVIDAENLEKLRDRISKYIQFLSKNKMSDINDENIRAEFRTLQLTSDSFVKVYLKTII